MIHSRSPYSLLLSLVVLSLLHAMAFSVVQADEGNPPSMQQSSFKVYGYLWNDSNCDGIRQSDEGVMPDDTSGGYRMSLFYIGNDGIPFTRDDSEVDVASAANGNIMYGVLNGGGGNTYYIAMRPSQRPAGFVPSPYQQGADRTLDNDMTVWPDGAWATGTFVIKATTVTGIDIGLCPIANLAMPHHVALPLVMH